MNRDERFKIYIEQLRDGHIEKIDVIVPSASLQLDDEELHFSDDVHVKGDVYIAGHELVFHLDINAQASLPCSVCNETVPLPLAIKGLYDTISLDDLKDGIFFMQEVVREAILLETPVFAECAGGQCPQRKDLEKFLKKPISSEEEDRYHPFADFDFEKTQDS